MKKIILSFIILIQYAMALNFGLLKIEPEIGLTFGLSKMDSSIYNDNKSYYGAYSRVWLGSDNGLVVAPQIKYTRLSNHSNNNIQIGALLGYSTMFGLTPYIGASYSKFEDFDNTYALNFGVKLDIPIIPFMTIGVDGSYTNPKTSYGATEISTKFMSVGATIGIAF